MLLRCRKDFANEAIAVISEEEVKINRTDVKCFLSAMKNMGVHTYIFDKGEELSLSKLQKAITGCTRCALSETRTHVVPGEGNPQAPLIFVGEAPGEDEDLQGRPFVGRAGKLLDKLIEHTGFRRNEVYICNVLKCRPPGNRDPEPAEADACKEYLIAQIDLIRPKVICTLGRHAYNTLLNVDERITRIRGKLTTYRGVKLLPAYHPSYLLRNQRAMPEAIADMQALAKLLGKR